MQKKFAERQEKREKWNSQQRVIQSNFRLTNHLMYLRIRMSALQATFKVTR